MFTVNVTMLGDPLKVVEVEEGATVAQALAAADVEVNQGSEVFRRGEAVTDLEETVTQGETFVVAKPVKGGLG